MCGNMPLNCTTLNTTEFAIKRRNSNGGRLIPLIRVRNIREPANRASVRTLSAHVQMQDSFCGFCGKHISQHEYDL